MRWYTSTRVRLAIALGVSNLASLGFFLAGTGRDHSWTFWYLNWNLFLAFIPYALSIWLIRMLRSRLWSSWQAIILSLFWLGFMPNTFYILTDFIHLRDVPRGDLVYDVMMIGSYVVNGFMFGLMSLYLIHGELRWRLRNRNSTLCMLLIIFLISFAIYLGRDLRLNTWDVFTSPASLLFEVSDQIIHAAQHPAMFSTTLGFFVLITTTYGATWQIVRASRQTRMPD